MPSMPRVLRSPWLWAFLLLLVAAYAGVGFLLVPRLLVSGVRDYVATHYHREAKIGAVTFNPFTLRLTIDGLAIPDADGGPLIGFDRLAVKASFASLVRGGADIESIALDGPRVRVVRRADHHVNLMDLVPPPDPKAEAKQDPNAPPPKLWIHELAIRGGEASVIDLARRTALNLTLKPITFTLNEFSTRSEGNAYHLAATSTRGEGLEWHGTFGLEPIVSKGNFKLSHIRAQTISEIGLDLLPLQISTGTLDVDGGYDIAEAGENLAVKARVDELLVSDAGLRAPGETEDWVTIPKLAITGTTLDLGAETVRVEHVALDGLSVRAWRDADKTINLTRLIKAPPAASPGAPADTKAAVASATPEDKVAKSWSVAVPDIRLTASTVDFEDRAPKRPATMHLKPLDVTVGGFAWPAAGPLDVKVDATINDGGHLHTAGAVTLAPLTAQLGIDASALGLAVLQPYLDDSTAMTLKSGTAGARGKLALGVDGAISYDGDAAIDNLRTVDNLLQEDFIKWRSLQLKGIHASSLPVALKVREVLAQGPYARVIITPTGQTNLAEILTPHAPGTAFDPKAAPEAAPPPPPPPPTTRRKSGKAPPAPAAAQAKALPVEIGLVRIADGSMNFADFSTKPHFATGIQDLAGTVKGISGRPGSRGELKLDGKVDRYAPVTIAGTMEFLAATHYADVKMSFKNMELTGLSPYSGKFAGYRIDKGKLSIDLGYHIVDRKLEATHHVVVNQLQLGDRVDSPDATSLPVKLAIALLKDKDGVIDLDLPVNGSLDDPQFKLGPIIWKVVVNLITKIVTSPFKLLGSLFGGGDEVSYIDFAAGSATLDPAGRGKVASLVKALDSRPALNLELPLIVATDDDTAAMNAGKWHAALVERAQRRLGKHAEDPGAVDALLAAPKSYRALLEDTYRESFGKKPEIPAPEPGATPPADKDAAAVAWLESQLKPRFVADAKDLEALARDRANVVQSALLDGTGIDPSRVFVIKTAPLASSGGPVRMQLSLH